MDDLDSPTSTGHHPLDDRIVIGFSRMITRKTLLSRAARGVLAFGAAASTSLWFADVASAWTCSPGGPVGTWGNYCAGTASCPSCNSDNSCTGRQRCTYWGSSPYCWCSLTSCINTYESFYSCCDCWNGGSGDCATAGGGTKCTCKQLVRTGVRCP